ncbi:MAG: MerR family DNA-binding transcriptional regulator [Myxococcales bacterium]|nr:MAG: MerR family DNA-binding transcriptional regulator [Myxococcales bacterium]
MADRGTRYQGTTGAVTPDAAEPARLSIGALARAADIPVATLRTWERRYGYPVPERKPSGHRVYPLSMVPRLRRVAEALARGYRAAEVLSASDEELEDLLRTIPAAAAEISRGAADNSVPLRAVERFDGKALKGALTADWARLGPVDFLERTVSPLLHEVGEAWAEGRLDVAHEHFLSEHVGDLLRSLRLPFDERAQGPLVVLATLPDELHALGLQMAALILAMAGCRICNLGANVPVDQIVTHSKELNARAVAVSVSLARADRRTATHLGELRSRLPRKIILLAGGHGASTSRRGVDVMPDLETLHAWGSRLAQQAS